MTKILIVDDEKSIRHTLKEILEYEKYNIDEAENGKIALQKITENKYDVVLCDIKMPEMDGIEVLENAKKLDYTPQFIMISAHATIDTAVDATKKGAYDFIQKPPDLNRLLLAIKNALDKSDLIEETKVLRKKVSKSMEIIGISKAIEDVKETIDKVAITEARVLITGSNGSGKELVANAIHKLSPRQKKQLIEVNCAAIPSELIESELFGHEKGSFTSAVKQRIGKFEQANNGTLFLDEIGDMSLSAQAKVLRVLQENRLTRVGGEKEIKVNVRVLAATNKDLKEEILAKRFREDLYHRLSVIIIKVPTLKERVGDIPLLTEKFLNDIAKSYGAPKKEIESNAIEAL
jgi:DNA-binding NtrC family response regulator